MQKDVELDGILLSPNPVHEQLSVMAPANTRIMIYNASGMIVWNGTMENDQTIIPVSSWDKGFYFVRLSKNGINVVEKIIVR